MTINLNSLGFDDRITKESILKYISQEDIYSFYIGYDIRDAGKIHSPFRDDEVPSFTIFYHKNERNVLMFYDHATKDSGDCFSFTMKMFGIDFHKALNKIAYDFNLTDFKISDVERKQLGNFEKIKDKKVVKIAIKKRDWTINDRNYWSQYGIKKATLEKFDVCSISHVFYNDQPVKSDELAYAYKEWKDGILSYKIYQPKSKFKWINNANHTVHQGYTKLPERGELLIITKSLKDVMSLHDTVGLPAVGLQSESVTMKESVMDEYKRRFRKVVCLFDNDDAGVKLSKIFSEQYKIPYFLMPIIPNVTDFSDLVKYAGTETAVTIFYEQLNRVNYEI